MAPFSVDVEPNRRQHLAEIRFGQIVRHGCILGSYVCGYQPKLFDYAEGLVRRSDMVDSEARSNFDQVFRRRLRLAREATGLALQDVADHIGIPKDTYAKYETRSMIPIAYLKAVCDLLGTDPWCLVTGKSSPKEDHFDRAHMIFLMVLTVLADRNVTDMDEVEVETWAAFLAGCFADDRLNEKDKLQQHLQSSIINLESFRRARQGKA